MKRRNETSIGSKKTIVRERANAQLTRKSVAVLAMDNWNKLPEEDPETESARKFRRW